MLLNGVAAQVGKKAPQGPARLRCALLAGLMAATTMALACDRERPPKEPKASPPKAAATPIPKIDVHTHIFPAGTERALRILGAADIQIALNASGGSTRTTLPTWSELASRTGGRILPLCHLQWQGMSDPRWPDYVVAELEMCKRLGGQGLKIFKALGLGYTVGGQLLAVDDPRLDLAFETAGKLGLPVLIHSGDPKAFFAPINAENERIDELGIHPEWGFYGPRRSVDGQVLGQWPSWEEILGQFERRVARHPQTTFIGAHFGNAPEEPLRVSRMLDRYANYYIDTAARIPEVGRHDANAMRVFYAKHQDRVLFGSDIAIGKEQLVLGSGDGDAKTPAQAQEFFQRHWRYFETRDQGFAHPTPIQGRWTIDGVGLSRAVLEKIYWRNASRVFGIKLPNPPQP